MKTFQYKVNDELGIHARPAGLLVKEAKKYQSKIMIQKEDKSVAASQLLGIMGMCVKQGEEVTVTVEGVDENEAYADMLKFFQENL